VGRRLGKKQKPAQALLIFHLFGDFSLRPKRRLAYPVILGFRVPADNRKVGGIACVSEDPKAVSAQSRGFGPFQCQTADKRTNFIVTHLKQGNAVNRGKVFPLTKGGARWGFAIPRANLLADVAAKKPSVEIGPGLVSKSFFQWSSS